MSSIEPAASKTWMNLSLGLRVSDGRFADVRGALACVGAPKQIRVEAVPANAACGLAAQARSDQQRRVMRRVAGRRLDGTLDACEREHNRGEERCAGRRLSVVAVGR